VGLRNETLREVATRLRKKVPAAHPVHFRVGKIPQEYAGYEALTILKVDAKGRHSFLILIDEKLHCHQCRVMALLHEWAHCRCWSHRHDLPTASHADFHDPAWGIAMAEVWLAFCA
jgi:hypothetical protein